MSTDLMKVKIYKKVKVKKLYRGHVSVRDYIVDHAIMHGLGLKIYFNKQVMTVPIDQVAQVFQFSKQSFSSQFSSGQKYQLIDFTFVPDYLKE